MAADKVSGSYHNYLVVIKQSLNAVLDLRLIRCEEAISFQTRHSNYVQQRNGQGQDQCLYKEVQALVVFSRRQITTFVQYSTTIR